MWERTLGDFLAVETTLLLFLCKKEKKERRKLFILLKTLRIKILFPRGESDPGSRGAPGISCVFIEASGHNILGQRGKRTASNAGGFYAIKISLKQITKEKDFTRIILHSCFSPLYTYIRKTVNVVGHGSSNVGPTICSLGLFTVFVIILRSVPGRPAFSVILDSEVLVAHVTCYQRTLTYGSVHIVPVNERSEICIQCRKSTARWVFITTNRLKFR